MFCRKCGTQLPENTAFCKKCGTPQNAHESHPQMKNQQHLANPQQQYPQMQEKQRQQQYHPYSSGADPKKAKKGIVAVAAVAVLVLLAVLLIFRFASSEDNQADAGIQANEETRADTGGAASAEPESTATPTQSAGSGETAQTGLDEPDAAESGVVEIPPPAVEDEGEESLKVVEDEVYEEDLEIAPRYGVNPKIDIPIQRPDSLNGDPYNDFEYFVGVLETRELLIEEVFSVFGEAEPRSYDSYDHYYWYGSSGYLNFIVEGSEVFRVFTSPQLEYLNENPARPDSSVWDDLFPNFPEIPEDTKLSDVVRAFGGTPGFFSAAEPRKLKYVYDWYASPFHWYYFEFGPDYVLAGEGFDSVH